MSGRETVLNNVRRAISASGDDEMRRQAVRSRLKSHRRNLIPKRSEGDSAHQLTLFRKMVEQVHATTDKVRSRADVPEAITAYLRRHNLPQAVRHGSDEALSGLPWSDKAPSLTVSTGPAEASDEVSVSHAFAGVAETGTLVMTSGPENPTTLNFLPENHIVVLDAKDIAGSYEDAWDKLRKQLGPGVMPRTVNMITGPSRTGDIGHKLELGAHGPRRLHIIIVKD